MAGRLLAALKNQGRKNHPNFTFQHKLCHDFESLIWVVVYAMMIRHRNTLAATDQVMYAEYKETVDECWAVHSYGSVLRSQVYMIRIGCSLDYVEITSSWFPDVREAAFFRDAMRLLRNQTQDGEPIAYETLCALFKKHVQLAKELHDSNLVPN